jgi:hypothetical protein
VLHAQPIHTLIVQYLVTADHVAPRAMSSSPPFPQKIILVFISSAHTFFIYFNSHFEQTEPRHMIHIISLYTLMVLMILMLAEIKKINRSQLEALARKKNTKRLFQFNV